MARPTIHSGRLRTDSEGHMRPGEGVQCAQEKGALNGLQGPVAPTTATNNYYRYKGPGRLCSSSNKFEIRGAPTASVFRRPPALRCLKADLSITKYKGSAGWSSAHCTIYPGETKYSNIGQGTFLS